LEQQGLRKIVRELVQRHRDWAIRVRWRDTARKRDQQREENKYPFHILYSCEFNFVGATLVVSPIDAHQARPYRFGVGVTSVEG